MPLGFSDLGAFLYPSAKWSNFERTREIVNAHRATYKIIIFELSAKKGM